MTYQNKKVALVHDTLLTLGGAERVLFALMKIFPQADVFTSLYSDKLSSFFSSPKSIIHLPPQYQIFHHFPELLKPWLFSYWEQIDLSQYDLVISSSHSFSSKNIITQPRTLHISYIHTPPRYLYTELNQYSFLKKKQLLPFITNMLQKYREKDFIAAQRPDYLIANSLEVKHRIQKYYRRDSTVIHPPISIPATFRRKKTEKYYLFHSRLVEQKGLELILATCNRYQLPLVVVGTGPQKKKFQLLAGPTIRFFDFLPDEQMDAIYEEALALLYASINEDFGMVPLEAIAHGVPVIAYRSGGVKETIIPRCNGVFFNEYSVESLWKAIQQTQKIKWQQTKLRDSVEKFSEKNFQKSILRFLSLNSKG